MRQLVWAWLPVVLYCTAIFTLSAIPAGRMPAGQLWSFDKLIHAAVYAVLGLLVCRALARCLPGWRRVVVALVAVAATSAYGLSDEWHQSLVPGRDASGFDLLADAIGAALAAAIWAFWRWDMQKNGQSRVIVR